MTKRGGKAGQQQVVHVKTNRYQAIGRDITNQSGNNNIQLQ